MDDILVKLHLEERDHDVGEYQKDPDYERKRKVACDIEEKLLSLLKNEERELFTEYINAQNDLLGIIETGEFVGGVKMGARFVIEVMRTNDNISY